MPNGNLKNQFQYQIQDLAHSAENRENHALLLIPYPVQDPDLHVERKTF